jgi:sialate O-acetylesterase
MALSSVALYAEVRIPAVFADHMVIQRESPVHAWGMANSYESVTISFRGEIEKTTANEFGRWSLYLHPGSAGGPFEMVVQGTNRIVLRDVLVGDVWIASGQSNMEFPMAEGMNRGVNNEKEELAAASHPTIRILDIAPASSDYPLRDVAIRHAWSECNPESVASFSAVGYFFARDLQQREKIPIGVIDDTWGGTPAEAWTSLDALSADASLMPVFGRRAKLMDELPALLLQEKREQQEYERKKQAGNTKAELPWHPDPGSWKPAGIYNAMVAPLTPFAIKGVIWYQGESNADDPTAVSLYGKLFMTLIQDWRRQWGEGDFPFLFVQIANWSPGTLWPEMRDQQRKALALNDTAMTVTIDIGDADNIHPKDKQDVGSRLALAARALAYNEQVEYSGPLVRQVSEENSALRILFTHAEGLISRGGKLQSFEIAGADNKYVPAQARIESNTVVVSSPLIKDPVYVRYGWAADPDCNLYNAAGLPASPFEEKSFGARE